MVKPFPFLRLSPPGHPLRGDNAGETSERRDGAHTGFPVRIDTFLNCTQLERKNLRKLDPELREGAIVSVSTVPNSNVIILSVFLEGRVQRKRYKNVVFFNTAVIDISLPQTRTIFYF